VYPIGQVYSVVTRDVMPHNIVAGVPAKTIRKQKPKEYVREGQHNEK
jgi:acetyltransferase-like isoleucine patch superfamily enzyme